MGPHAHLWEGSPNCCLPGTNGAVGRDDALSRGALARAAAPVPAQGLAAELGSQPRLGLRYVGSCLQPPFSMPSPRTSRRLGWIVKEINSQCHELPRCISSVGSQHLVALFIQVLEPMRVTGRGPGWDLGLLPHHAPTHPGFF